MQVIKALRQINHRKYFVYMSFSAVLIIFSVLLWDKGFLSYHNMMNILKQTAMISVAGVGMTFAMSAGLIDLSTGEVAAVSALTTGLLLRQTGCFPAVAGGLSVGLLCGFANGLLVAKVKIPAFLATLGTSSVFAGIARIASTMADMEVVPITNSSFNYIFGSGAIWVILIVLLGHVIYKKTPFGKAVPAVGENETQARHSGIKVGKIKIWVMVACGVTASFAGILYAGRLNMANYNLGENDSLIAITAVVLGGTSFAGGKGTVIGTVIGAVLMGMLNNGLMLMSIRISEPIRMIARGIVIVLVAALSLRQFKKDKSTMEQN